MTVYNCHECGTVTKCYPNCPTLPYEEDCPCFHGSSCPSDYQHKEEQ